MHLQCTMSSISDWEVRRLGMRDTVRHGTITVSGFGYFHKNCCFLWGKFFFQRQIQEVQYTIPIRHITNISDFVWFQRSCGSMKSVFSFSIIDICSVLIHHGGCWLSTGIGDSLIARKIHDDLEIEYYIISGDLNDVYLKRNIVQNVISFNSIHFLANQPNYLILCQSRERVLVETTFIIKTFKEFDKTGTCRFSLKNE